MNPSESVLQFKGYKVTEAHFKKTHFVPEDGAIIDLNPSFTHMIREISSCKYAVILGIQIGTTGDEGPLPFYAKVELEGYFTLADTELADTLLSKNATAILFPYLRSSLTQLTALANINPIILPTVNLADSLKNAEITE